MANERLKRLSLGVLVFQGLGVLAVSLISWPVWSLWGALGVLLGGAAGVLGQAVMVWFLTLKSSRDSKAFVQRFFFAEALKFFIAGGAFAGILLLGAWAPGALLGFCIAVVGALVGPRVLERRVDGHVS